MQREIRIERIYPHPRDRVWKALTDPDALAAWFAENDFQAVVGHRFTLRTDPGPGYDGILSCEVLEVEPPRRLVYSFRGGVMKHTTIVTWTLEEHHEGTFLRLEHTGWKGIPDIVISYIIGSGWSTFMANLPEVLADLAAGRLRGGRST